MHLLLFINTRKFTFNNGNKMEYTFTLLSLRLALMKVYFLVMNSKSCKRDLSYPNEFSLFTSLVVLYPDLYTFCCSLPVNVLSYAKLELINAKIHSFYWDDTHLRFCHDILKFYTKSHVHEHQQTTINTILLYIGGNEISIAHDVSPVCCRVDLKLCGILTRTSQTVTSFSLQFFANKHQLSSLCH